MPSIGELRRDFIASSRDVAPLVSLPEVSGPDSLAGAGASLFPDEAVAPLRALGPCTIAIGAFDGFHAGHRALIDAAVRDAHARGMASVAFTFDPDPDVVVSSRPARRLTCASDRHALLAVSGVDAVASIPFTRDLASLSFDAFLSIMVCMVCDVRSIHVGSNFRFGRGGTATVADMDTWCSRRGIDVCGHDLVLDDGEPVSSTRIRASLRAGDLAPVERELGRRYLVRGRVQSGRGEGTGMGFPTANIAVDGSLQLPAEGVYEGLALVRGEVWPAAINVGVPPTFKDRARSASLEANLIGFSGDIYDDEISLVFARRLRGLVKFSSVDELIRTVLGNIETVKADFGEKGVPLV